MEVKIRGSSVSTLATHNALPSTGHLEIQTPTRSYNWNRETYELTLGMNFPTQMVCCMLLLWFCMYLSCGSRFRRLERKQNSGLESGCLVFSLRNPEFPSFSTCRKPVDEHAMKHKGHLPGFEVAASPCNLALSLSFIAP